MEKIVSGAFAEILEKNRYSLNARFADARKVHPNLDNDAFSDLLSVVVEPIVSAVDHHDHALVQQVAMILYDLGLNLIGRELLGPTSRFPMIEQGWRDLLPQIPQHLLRAPRKVIGTLTNALYNLSLQPGARPREWMDLMSSLVPLAENEDVFLQGGQIVAWRAGMPQFREGALDLCKIVPSVLARAALGLSNSSESLSIETIVDSLSSDPWLHPNSIGNQHRPKSTVKIVGRVGAFRGFGGLFRQPPTVFRLDENFVVKDGNTYYLLFADVFGTALHRMDYEPDPTELSSFKIHGEGNVLVEAYAARFPELRERTSMAANQSTLVVTSALSFSVNLIAMTYEK